MRSTFRRQSECPPIVDNTVQINVHVSNIHVFRLGGGEKSFVYHWWRNSTLGMWGFRQIARGEAWQVQGTHLPCSYTTSYCKHEKPMVSDRKWVDGNYGEMKGYDRQEKNVAFKSVLALQLLMSSFLTWDLITWWLSVHFYQQQPLR